MQQPSVKECECDEDSLAAAIMAKLPKYPTADELGDAVANKLKGDTTFITAIAAQIKVDVPRPALERHIVIVANQKASYWPRLSDELNRVKDIYQGIEVADPPANYRGHLPQAILYESGKPRVLGVGQNQVSGVLQRLSRGDDF